MGRLIFHINSAYAEFEREIIRERVKAGIRAKREKTGRWGRTVLDQDIQTQITPTTSFNLFSCHSCARGL
jgi:DNA invertase Pin-like site-specific DNA recombinase